MTTSGFLSRTIPQDRLISVRELPPGRRNRIENVVDGLFNFTDHKIIGVFAAREKLRDPELLDEHHAQRRRAPREERFCQRCFRGFTVRVNRKDERERRMCAGCERVIQCDCGREFERNRHGPSSTRCPECRDTRLREAWREHNARRARKYHRPLESYAQPATAAGIVANTLAHGTPADSAATTGEA